jgi:hypothetical protein
VTQAAWRLSACSSHLVVFQYEIFHIITVLCSTVAVTDELTIEIPLLQGAYLRNLEAVHFHGMTSFTSLFGVLQWILLVMSDRYESKHSGRRFESHSGHGPSTAVVIPSSFLKIE